MPSTTFVARRAGSFTTLIQSAGLGGYTLDPLPPVTVRDRYYDAADGALLLEGMALRVRETSEERLAQLRALPSRRDRAQMDASEPLKAKHVPPDGPLTLPRGPLREVVRRWVGEDPLRPLVHLRQYRTPRVVRQENRLVGLLAFDVVIYETPGAPHISNEVEVDLSKTGTTRDLEHLAQALQAHGLEVSDISKFERGVLRLPRTLDETLLLIPEEHDALERLHETGTARESGVARVLLLDARGFRDATIATHTGASPARIRHWRHQFRKHRMGLFERLEASEVLVPSSGELRPSRGELHPEPSASVSSERPSEKNSVTKGSTEAAPQKTKAMPDEGAVAELEVERLDDLLDLFQPSATSTPFFHVEEDESDGGSVTIQDEPRDPESSISTGPFEIKPTLSDLAWSEPSETASSETASSETALPMDGHRPAPSHRSQSDDLLAVAYDVLSDIASRLDDARRVVMDGKEVRSQAGPVLFLSHRLRQGMSLFSPALPAPTVDRLRRGGGHTARFADAVLDLSAACDHLTLLKNEEPGPRDRLSIRARTAERAFREHLAGAGYVAWRALLERLLERLRIDAAATPASDDTPLRADDFAGLREARGPHRLSHRLASALWAEAERCRLLADFGDLCTPETAYRLAIGLSDVRFVLRAFPDPPSTDRRRLDARLAEGERRAAAYRHERRCTELLREEGVSVFEVALTDEDLRSAAEIVHHPETRTLLGRVAAEV